MSAILYYALDPMCSWCWAFRPAWSALQDQLPDGVRVKTLLGGLAPDNASPMPTEMRTFLQDTWRRIEQRVPGTRFNFDFWERCEPRRSTYPACRAVIAARNQDPEHEATMTLAIQRAYYEQARNPSDTTTLAELALANGLDGPRFLHDLSAPDTQMELAREIAETRSLGLSTFPAMALETCGTRWPVSVEYTDPQAMLANIRMLLE
jgi:putative protein-disulfide isomerase